jgi:PAS domain S-box-containing protein
MARTARQPRVTLHRPDVRGLPGGPPLSIYDSLACAVWVRDANGRITYANPAAARVFRIDANTHSPGATADSLGWDLCDENGCPLARDNFPSVSAFRTCKPELRRIVGIKAADRAVQWVLIDSLPVTDAFGTLLHVISSAVDVTALKQAELALRASEERYRRIVESTHEGLCEIDTHSTITFVNGKLCDMFGYKREELLGRHSFELFRSSSRTPLDPAGRVAAGTAENVPLQHRDGRQLWVNVSGVPIVDEAGRAAGVLAMFTDVTERKLSQERDRRHEQAEATALVHERERIAMDLHDGAMQSLYGVALSLGALRRHAADRSGQETVLGQAIDQLTDTIQDIRDYIYQLRTGSPEEADLRAGLESRAGDLGAAGIAGRVSITAGLDHLSPETTRHLLYIVQEALSNVVRHANASRVVIQVVPWRNGMALSVSDNGQGFDPRRRGRRAGDGLRNMRERAALVGATLRIRSAPRSGTTVTVQLP